MTTPPRSIRLRPAAVGACCLAAGVAALLTAIRHGPWAAPAIGLLAGLGSALGLVDARTLRLPDRLVAALAAGVLLLGAGAAVGGVSPHWFRAGTGAVASVAAFGALAWSRPGALGLGDVKLAPVLGAYLGWFGPVCWVTGTAAAFLLAGAAAALLCATGRARRTTMLPFGPFLVAGALAAVLGA